MKAKRIYFPTLSLFVTLCACSVLLLDCYVNFVTTSGLVRAGRQPVWMQAYFHSTLIHKSVPLAIAAATVGSALTVWLLLRTEAPAKAQMHFKNLSLGVGAGAVSGFLLVLTGMGIGFISAAFSPQGLAQLGSMTRFVQIALMATALVGTGLGVLTLVGLSIPYALFTLISRARNPSSAPVLAATQPFHNPN